jgi:hypothetical protein
VHAVAALQVDVNQGFEFRDLVVPLATFVGGLLGVIVGARLSHRTLHSVEKERTEREMQFERARERREGHCNFTPAELVAGVLAIQHRVDTGRWSGVATPRSLQATATALGLGDAAFIAYRPSPLTGDNGRFPPAG